MRTWQVVGAVSLVLASVSGCSSPPVLPERTNPAVKAEEARLAAVLSAGTSVLGVPGACKVRLVGQQAKASFVMADCKARDSSYRTYGPKRVDGSKVTTTADGGGYSESLRKMFPEDLAQFVLDNADSPKLRP